MTQFLAEKITEESRSWERHKDPAGLWIAVFAGSCVIHLLFFWWLIQSRINYSLQGEQFSTNVPVEFVELPSKYKPQSQKLAQNPKTEVPAPPPKSTKLAPANPAPVINKVSEIPGNGTVVLPRNQSDLSQRRKQEEKQRREFEQQEKEFRAQQEQIKRQREQDSRNRQQQQEKQRRQQQQEEKQFQAEIAQIRRQEEINTKLRQQEQERKRLQLKQQEEQFRREQQRKRLEEQRLAQQRRLQQQEQQRKRLEEQRLAQQRRLQQQEQQRKRLEEQRLAQQARLQQQEQQRKRLEDQRLAQQARLQQQEQQRKRLEEQRLAQQARLQQQEQQRKRLEEQRLAQQARLQQQEQQRKRLEEQRLAQQARLQQQEQQRKRLEEQRLAQQARRDNQKKRDENFLRELDKQRGDYKITESGKRLPDSRLGIFATWSPQPGKLKRDIPDQVAQAISKPQEIELQNSISGAGDCKEKSFLIWLRIENDGKASVTPSGKESEACRRYADQIFKNQRFKPAYDIDPKTGKQNPRPSFLPVRINIRRLKP